MSVGGLAIRNHRKSKQYNQRYQSMSMGKAAGKYLASYVSPDHTPKTVSPELARRPTSRIADDCQRLTVAIHKLSVQTLECFVGLLRDAGTTGSGRAPLCNPIGTVTRFVMHRGKIDHER